MCFGGPSVTDNGAAAAAQAQAEAARENAKLERDRWARSDEQLKQEKADQAAAAAKEEADRIAALTKAEQEEKDRLAAEAAAAKAQESAKSATGNVNFNSQSTMANTLAKQGTGYNDLLNNYSQAFGYGQGQTGYAGQQNQLISSNNTGFNDKSVGGRRYA